MLIIILYIIDKLKEIHKAQVICPGLIIRFYPNPMPTKMEFMVLITLSTSTASNGATVKQVESQKY